MKEPAQGIPSLVSEISANIPLEQAIQIAGQHIDAGRIQQGETILRQILQQQPKYPPALALLGVIAHFSGKTELGIRLLSEAIESLPHEAQYHSNLGEMYRITDRTDEAIHHCKTAVELRPDIAQYHSNLGIAYFDNQDYDNAEACQKRALELSSQHVAALNNLGSIAHARKEVATAIDYYKQALVLAPKYHEPKNNLGSILIGEDRIEEGVGYLQEVLQDKPDYLEARNNLANTYFMLGEEQRATDEFTTVLKMSPDNPDALLGMSSIDMENDLLPEAMEKVEKVLTQSPDDVRALSLLGDINVRMGFYDRAEQFFDQAIALDSENFAPYLGKGKLFLELGQIDEADACHRAALKLDEDNLMVRHSLCLVRKVKPGDENFLYLEKMAQSLDPTAKRKGMPIHFSLGKCYDDTGAYEKAFPHFMEGSRLQRERIHYDENETGNLFSAIKTYLDKATIDRLRGSGDPSTLPIFVLGMPRSGTTLVETILASHSAVFGAGELTDMARIANNPLAEIETEQYPYSLQYLSGNDLSQMGARYANGLKERDERARYITDKMPANFLYMGLIHLILPNARIIHVRRNPVDVCLSGFTRLFASKSQPHSYDLSEMGHYYHHYARLMEHWRSVLPTDAFYEVEYESLVSEPEPEVRKLIDYCNLDWQDACLESHKTQRSVKTASITQVRQPIYTSSIERWRHYEKFLGPLMEALGEYAPQ